MSAAYECSDFDGPGFDLDNDLPGALRAGLANLHAAATCAGLGDSAVDEVVGSAWSPFTLFSAHETADYNAVVTLAVRVNGWAWAEAVLIDPRPRDVLYERVTTSGWAYARKHYWRLGADAEAAADDAVMHLGPMMLLDSKIGLRVPAWTSPAVVNRNVVWRLSTAADAFDRRNRAGDGGAPVMSLDAYFEACGERGAAAMEYGTEAVDDHGVEAAVWAAAGANLRELTPSLLEAAHAGAKREKLRVTVTAAAWVLGQGSEDELDDEGGLVLGSAEETRQRYAEDPMLVAFSGLRAALPDTWGTFPDHRVPLLSDLRAAARDAENLGGPQREWFSAVSTRKNELHRRGFVLHRIKDLVESQVRGAAHDTGN